MTQWKEIQGYEGLYEVSDDGRVRSVERTVTDNNGRKMKWGSKILAPGRMRKGHLVVTLSKGGKTKTFLLSRLVCAAFNGPAPEGAFCLHFDGDTENNYPNNLRWGSNAENMKDMIRHGNNGFKLDAQKAKAIHALIGKQPRRKIAEMFDVTEGNVCAIARGRVWREATGADVANKGKLSGNKITSEIARKIFNLDGHIVRRDIARFFGVTTVTVGQIINGKTWAHATGAGGN